jgi:diacylglycerol kinase
MISPKRFLKSLKHALRGVAVVFKHEQSFRIQVVAAIFVFILAWYVGARLTEWIILLLMVGSVMVLELINSIFERIVDTFKPRIHPAVKDIKDIMAGAVLIASIAAAAIGIAIFYPYLNLVG